MGYGFYFSIRFCAVCTTSFHIILFIQEKYFFGHSLYPILLHGRHFISSASMFIYFPLPFGIYGYIPNCGVVLPHMVMIFFLYAAAICISPVSDVITTAECFTYKADCDKEHLPHILITLGVFLIFMFSKRLASFLSPKRTMLCFMFWHKYSIYLGGICLVVCVAPHTMDI